jgi:glycosyltransferase involved in cell wall biosynthesis
VRQNLVFAVPGDLSTPTGGYAYDRRIIAELTKLGWHIDVANLGNDFPHPSAPSRNAALRLLSAVPAGIPIVVDGLAFGALPDEAEQLAPRHPLIALVHHPLALETGLARDEAEAFHVAERRALAQARRVVATSAATARLLAADYRLPPDRIHVVPPGQDKALATRNGGSSSVRLLAVGAVVLRKGYDCLIEALAILPEQPWHLTIAGDRNRDPATAARLDAEIARLGLGARIERAGAVSPSRLAQLYASADIFVLPSRFEGYGMAFAEALAYGLPVVGTTAGAVPETVPADAGVLVPPDDPQALAEALRELIENPAKRDTLAAAARRAATQLPKWQDSARLFAQAVEAAL